MIYVKIELWPKGNREGRQILHEGFIWNDMTGTDRSGNYEGILSKRGGFGGVWVRTLKHPTSLRSVWRRIRVEGFARKSYSAWELLTRFLEAARKAE